jgi:hypothetical protein
VRRQLLQQKQLTELLQHSHTEKYVYVRSSGNAVSFKSDHIPGTPVILTKVFRGFPQSILSRMLVSGFSGMMDRFI